MDCAFRLTNYGCQVPALLERDNKYKFNIMEPKTKAQPILTKV